MDDKQLLDYVRQLLHNTFSNQLQIQQSEMELKNLLENEPHFVDVIGQIALNDTDISIRKAAIIQTRYLNPENILELFLFFNEKLDPCYHQMITFLSDLLTKKYPNILLDFCINFNNLSVNNINDFVIQMKTLMMAFLSLKRFIDDQYKDTNEFLSLKSSFFDKLPQNIQLIYEIFKSNIESNDSNFSQQQILFFHYFIQVFYEFFCMDISIMEQIYQFIHFFLCSSLKFKIDNLYDNLDTKIIYTLFNFYILFYGGPGEFQHNIKFDELINSFEIYRQNVPITSWPVPFIVNINSFIDSDIVYEKFKNYTEHIISNYIFPLFSFNFFTNIISDIEFVDLYYPNLLSHNLQSYAIMTIGKSYHNEYLSLILFKFAQEQLNKSLLAGQSDNIFSIVNMISYCCYANTPFQNQILTDFYCFVSSQLLNINDPLVIISVMHFLSKTPPDFPNVPPIFVNYIFAGLFNNFQIPEDSLMYINIIQYFSIVAYSTFRQNGLCPSFTQEPEKMKYILDNTIRCNEYYKTEDASIALDIIIKDLPEIDIVLLQRLITCVWQLFIEESCDDVITAARYFVSLSQIFDKCQQQLKILASEMIFNLIEELLHSSTNPENIQFVISILNFYNDEIFNCLAEISNYLTQIFKNEQCNALFIQIRNIIFNIFSLLKTDEFEWENLDRMIMQFVNLKDKINYKLLLEFFTSFVQMIIDQNWTPEGLFSLKAFLANFSQYPDVNEFHIKYSDIISYIFEQSQP